MQRPPGQLRCSMDHALKTKGKGGVDFVHPARPGCCATRVWAGRCANPIGSRVFRGLRAPLLMHLVLMSHHARVALHQCTRTVGPTLYASTKRGVAGCDQKEPPLCRLRGSRECEVVIISARIECLMYPYNIRRPSKLCFMLFTERGRRGPNFDDAQALAWCGGPKHQCTLTGHLLLGA